MAIQRIDSIDDPRVAPYRNLRDRTLRGESIFVAEGRLVTLRLLASTCAVQSVFVSEEYAAEFERVAAGRAPLYVAHESLLLQVVGFK
ncbi:MAG: RNA methyltransferase, partial [Lentisphaerae bacterium]|nr:RNA methyltransferase [Lentisphaerota bacterium]